MKTFQLFLLITGLAYSTAVITVEVRLHSYSNPQSRECDGDTCDPDTLGAECDNIFLFCLRAAGSGSCLNMITTDEISEDTLSFSTSQLSELGISNPLRFSDITTSTELELFVRITDEDFLRDDELVDEFIIPFDRQQRPDSTFGSPITRSGSCGIGTSISISINITSVCPTPNFIGPQCTCPERENQNTCTYFGERQCIGNYAPDDCNSCNTGFQAPGCDTCAPDFYPANICTVFCQPRNDAQGHYTCNPITGARECLPMYTDPRTDCVNCIGNFREPDCTQCDSNFQGTECNTCAPNYYPQGVCNIMCQPRNDSQASYTCNRVTGQRECGQNFYPQGNCETFCLARNDSSGHYTCDPLTGDKICLAGYEDPTTDCRQMSELPSTSTVSDGSSDTFVGSLVFIVVVGVAVAVPFLALFIVLCILCVMCALSSNWSCPRLDCSCPKLDCSCPSFDCSCPSLDCSCPSFDCSCPKINCSCPKINCDLCNCSDFCKWMTCGFKLDDANPCGVCIICILVILASPAIILVLAVVGPVFLIGACLLYSLLHMCES